MSPATVALRAVTGKRTGAKRHVGALELGRPANAENCAPMGTRRIVCEGAGLKCRPRAIVEVDRASSPGRFVLRERTTFERAYNTDAIHDRTAVFSTVLYEGAA